MRIDRLRPRAARDDLIAALVVAALLIPQSLAYALLAGLPVEAGLYASLLPLVAYAAFGSSALVSIGPVAVLALMIAQAIGDVPAGASAAALVLAAEVGLLLALAALLRLDALAALLSVPVLHGFETGALLSIAIGQLPGLVGATAGGSTLPAVARAWFDAATPWSWPTACFGAGALALLWLGKRRAQPWLAPARATLVARLAPLAVLLAAIALAVAVDAGSHGVALVGALPSLAPRLTLPPLDAALWLALLPQAALIALVAYVTSLVIAESLARHRGERVIARREMAGLAAANLAAAISSGMPVAASFSRSAVALEAGARTRWAGVFVALAMALAIALFARPLASLPVAVLSATIIAAVLSVLDPKPFRQAWRYAPSEWLLMVAVAALTLLASIGWALGIGVAASVALLLQRTARPHVALIGRVPGTEHYRNVDRHDVLLTPGVMALRIDESLLFTNARQLADVVLLHLGQHGGTSRVVLLMSPVNRIDLSGLEALRALHDLLAARGVRLDLSEVKGPVLDRLRAGGWDRWFGGRVFLSHHQGMQDAG